ncbi:MAG: molybdopterin-dependent oxidoreductase [Chlorobi bacterium]|nr:molybdopterin-dependent oxidoreductase [Chlorobiota bacterium]
MTDQWIRTACPRNCYSSCGFLVRISDGRVIECAPDPENKATPGGMCLKGQSYPERVYSPDRLLYPLHRNVAGGFNRIPWPEAIDEIVHHLKTIASEYGQQAVMYYAGSGMAGLVNDLARKFWEAYGGITTTYGNLCWPAGLEATRLTLGENKHNMPWDLENTRLIIMWGKNAAETNVHEMVFVDRALERGAEMIVIDPRRTPTADRAHLLIQPRPGTDGALALGIARILINDKLTDTAFIEKHVLGYDEFEKQVRQYTVKRVEEITGIPARYIHLLAEKTGNLKPMTILPGFGLQRYTNGGQTIRCLLSLQVITGNIGKPGACWHYANLQGYVFDKIKEPLSYYPPAQPGNIRYGISKARLGKDMLATDHPSLRFAWVERGNPLTQNPDSPTVRTAFQQLDFRVVIDQFVTDTARVADIILPAKSLFEQSDIIGSYWNPYIQYKPKVTDPPGEVKTETEIYSLLAQKLFPSEVWEQERFPEGDKATEKWLENRVHEIPGIHWKQIKKGAVIPPDTEEIAFEGLEFDTPSGRIELYSKRAAGIWNVSPLPEYVPPEFPEDMQALPLYLQTPNTKNRIHSQFGNLASIRSVEGPPVLDMNPEDAAFRQIREGDRVRVFNRRGDFRVRVHIDYGLIPGVVSIPNGIWHSEGAGANELSAPLETDMGYGAAFHNTRVDVEKFTGE